jgi:hypothetical protein
MAGRFPLRKRLPVHRQLETCDFRKKEVRKWEVGIVATDGFEGKRGHLSSSLQTPTQFGPLPIQAHELTAGRSSAQMHFSPEGGPMFITGADVLHAAACKSVINDSVSRIGTCHANITRYSAPNRKWSRSCYPSCHRPFKVQITTSIPSKVSQRARPVVFSCGIFDAV